jgi:hypothetical protein
LQLFARNVVPARGTGLWCVYQRLVLVCGGVRGATIPDHSGS